MNALPGLLSVLLLDVCVPGKPVGASRPRAVAFGGHARVHMPSDHRNAESFAMDRFVLGWGGQAPLDEPVVLDLEVVVERPQSKCRKKDPVGRMPCCSKPDLDNVAKLQMDALVKAGVLKDDTRVVELRCRKMYAAISPAEAPHVRVRVSRWVEG